LKFFTEYRERDWPECLITVEFVVNNKVYFTAKGLLIMANYGRELRIGAGIRRRKNMEKSMKFVERIRKVQEES